jgi:type III secretion system FlhB-like substrate exporter/AAA+ superfamily predicted ATPase
MTQRGGGMVFSGDKRASVIICSGNSLAVAIRYNEKIDISPVVVGKARGLNALIFIKTAQHNEIPIKQNPQLARNLLPLKANHMIPQNYWETIANILVETSRDKNPENEQKDKKPKSLLKANVPSFDLFSCIHVNKIAVETGAALSDEKTITEFQNKISEIRKTIAGEFGFVLPFVNIQKNEKIENGEYRIFLKNVEAARGNPEKEPLREITERLYTIIKQNAAEFAGYQETQAMLSSFGKTHPDLVNRVLEIYDIGEINTVLKNLLAEQVSIINLADILETLICFAESRDNRRHLTEMVREKLGLQICMRYAEYIDGKYTLFVFTLNPKLEQAIIDSEAEILGLAAFPKPETEKKWQDALSGAVEFANEKGHAPVILCTSKARYLIKENVMRYFPNLAVISVPEIYPAINAELLYAIDIQEEFETKPAVTSGALEELENLIGLTEVKKQVDEIKRFIECRGKETLPSLHMVFRGNPGTGKTVVARLVGKIFSDLGVLNRKDVFIETGREGLVAKYVGQTAIKTAKQCKAARGGVLFIDEAYTLGMSGHENDFGYECIATLVKYMENMRNDFVCIMAGYADQMDVMIKRNPGLKDRVQFYIDFPDYTVEELVQIFKQFCKKANLVLDQNAEAELFSWLILVKKAKQEHFSNARMVRKLFERTQIQQALRTRDSAILLEDLKAAWHSKDMAEFIKEPGIKICF